MAQVLWKHVIVLLPKQTKRATKSKYVILLLLDAAGRDVFHPQTVLPIVEKAQQAVTSADIKLIDAGALVRNTASAHAKQLRRLEELKQEIKPDTVRWNHEHRRYDGCDNADTAITTHKCAQVYSSCQGVLPRSAACSLDCQLRNTASDGVASVEPSGNVAVRQSHRTLALERHQGHTPRYEPARYR